MKRSIAVLLILILSLSLEGCAPSKAELNGEKVSLSEKISYWSLNYCIGDGFELVSEDEEWGSRYREYRVAGQDFWVRVAEIPINLAWKPMQDEIDAIAADEDTSGFLAGARKYTGKDRMYVSFDTVDPEHGGAVTKHFCYFLYDYMGIRYYYRIEFINCSESTAGFEDAFLRNVTTAK